MHLSYTRHWQYNGGHYEGWASTPTHSGSVDIHKLMAGRLKYNH